MLLLLGSILSFFLDYVIQNVGSNIEIGQAIIGVICVYIYIYRNKHRVQKKKG